MNLGGVCSRDDTEGHAAGGWTGSCRNPERWSPPSLDKEVKDEPGEDGRGYWGEWDYSSGNDN